MRCLLLLALWAPLAVAARQPLVAGRRWTLTLRGGQGDVAEEVPDELNEFVDDMAKGFDDAAADAGAASESLSEKMADAAASAKETAKRMAHQTEEAAEAMAAKASDFAKDAGEKLEEAGGAVAAELSAAYDEAAKGAERMERKLEATARENPQLARAVLAGTSFGLGDLIAQKLLSGKRRVAGSQALGLAGFGAALSPIFFRLCTAAFEGKSVLEIAQRVALDELVIVPIVLVFYFCASGLVGGHSPQEVIEKMEVHLPQAVGMSWLVFPSAQIVDHFLKDPKHKLGSAAAFMTLYSALLSYLDSKAL